MTWRSHWVRAFVRPFFPDRGSKTCKKIWFLSRASMLSISTHRLFPHAIWGSCHNLLNTIIYQLVAPLAHYSRYFSVTPSLQKSPLIQDKEVSGRISLSERFLILRQARIAYMNMLWMFFFLILKRFLSFILQCCNIDVCMLCNVM